MGLLCLNLSLSVLLLLFLDFLLTKKVCLLALLHLRLSPLLNLFLSFLLCAAVSCRLLLFSQALESAVNVVLELKLDSMGHLDVHKGSLVHVSVNEDVVFTVFTRAHGGQSPLLRCRRCSHHILRCSRNSFLATNNRWLRGLGLGWLLRSSSCHGGGLLW